MVELPDRTKNRQRIVKGSKEHKAIKDARIKEREDKKANMKHALIDYQMIQRLKEKTRIAEARLKGYTSRMSNGEAKGYKNRIKEL